MILVKSIKSALAILFLVGSVACERTDSMADRIVMSKEGDKALDAAIQNAISELPLFWDRFAHPKPGDDSDSFSVKVQIGDTNGYEFFFLGDIKRNGDHVSGVIDAKPQIVKCVKLNQRIEVPITEVIDWLFMSNGKMKGNFTTRALIKDIPKEDREQLIKLFDANPSIRGGA